MQNKKKYDVKHNSFLLFSLWYSTTILKVSLALRLETEGHS